MGCDQTADQLAPAFDDFGLELAPGDIALGATAAGAAYNTPQYVGTGGLGRRRRLGSGVAYFGAFCALRNNLSGCLDFTV